MFKKIISSMALVAAAILPQAAKADTWGCEVLLCLSNPAGPMAVAQCIQPITRLYNAIFRWRPQPFPTCTLSSGLDSSSGGNYAYVAPPSYYDNCPAGMTDLPSGEYVGTPDQMNVVAGIGDGAGIYPSTGDSAAPMPVKTCVGKFLSTGLLTTGTGRDDSMTYTVNSYDQITFIQPGATSFNINVIVNNALYKNIRPNFN